MASFTERFSAYFDREVAQKASTSLSNGIKMEFRIEAEGQTPELFYFTKVEGKNRVIGGPVDRPEVTFTLPQVAAEEILADTSESIAEIGVRLAHLMLAHDPSRRISIRIRTGFLSLFGKGYFGVLTSGGSAFGGFLASKGLSGMGALKAALKKLTGES